MSNFTEAQHAQRRKGIGASESAAILGLSPYKSALDVYLEKIGAAAPFEGNAATEWGTRLEAVVGNKFASDHQIQIRPGVHTVNPSIDFLFATPDFHVVDDSSQLIEVKTAGIYSADRWGEPGTDEVPVEYVVQATHQMIVTNARLVHVPVLIGGQDYREYRVEYSAKFADSILPRLEAFWDCVKTQTPPAPQNVDDVLRLHPRDDGELITATPTMIAKLKKLAEMKEYAANCEKEKESLEEEIKQAIGGASGLCSSQGKALATWKATNPSQSFDKAGFAAAHPEIYEKFCSEKPGSRRFLLKKENVNNV